eukprot:COSAG03_NODE_1713_length_3611_cov_114.287016_2_plen_162_part_00
MRCIWDVHAMFMRCIWDVQGDVHAMYMGCAGRCSCDVYGMCMPGFIAYTTHVCPHHHRALCPDFVGVTTGIRPYARCHCALRARSNLAAADCSQQARSCAMKFRWGRWHPNLGGANCELIRRSLRPSNREDSLRSAYAEQKDCEHSSPSLREGTHLPCSAT